MSFFFFFFFFFFVTAQVDIPDFRVIDKEMNGISKRADLERRKVASFQGLVNQWKAEKKITHQQARHLHQRLSKLANSLTEKNFEDKMVPLVLASKSNNNRYPSETMDVVNQLKSELDVLEKEVQDIVKVMEAAQTKSAPRNTPTGELEN